MAHEGIVIVGASGHAKVIIDIIEKQASAKIVGLVDSFKEPGTTLMDYRVIGRETVIPQLLESRAIVGGIVAIGHNWIRHQVANRIRELSPQFCFVNAIHPSAQIARGVTLGHGIAIMAGVSVNSGSQIGNFAFLNTNSSVDHDNTLGEFSCLQPNAVTGGNVKVGPFSVISIGATVIHGITIGAHSVVGAGATVLTDIPDAAVAYGTPCRVIRSRTPDETYY